MNDNLEITQYEEAFALLERGVHVITADDGERKSGCTVVWVSRSSFDPPMVSLYLSPQRFTHDLIKRAGHFCINIVGVNHLELARAFGIRSARDVDKFEGIGFEKEKSGAPVLMDACAFIDCELVEQFTTGDHTCFVGRVVAAERQSDEEPLLYRYEDFYPKEEEADAGGER